MAFDRFFSKDASTHILKVEQRNPLIPKIRDQKSKKLISPGKPEAKIVEPAVRAPAAAEGNATISGAVVPRPATEDAVGVVCRALRICLRAYWVFTVPILTPLPDVAAHVVQPKGIGLEAGYRLDLAF